MRAMSFAMAAMLLAATGQVQAATLIYNGGSPNLANGNEIAQWVQAEDFVLAANASLESVRFWTIESPTASWDGSLQWYLFADNGGQPAASAFGSGSGTSISKAATGNIALGFYVEYQYDFSLLSPVALTAGTTYWLGLHVNNNFNRADVYWETTNGAGATAFGRESENGTFTNWTSNGANHAFELYGSETRLPPQGPVVPEPTSLALAGFAGIGMAVRAIRRRQQAGVAA